MFGAASYDADADPATEHTEVKVEALGDDEAAEEAVDISALSHTTSAHDDWLHRGPFLYDMDFHTYVEYVHHEPRAVRASVTDMERQQDIFLFDAHYALADSYVQTLDTHRASASWSCWRLQSARRPQPTTVRTMPSSNR